MPFKPYRMVAAIFAVGPGFAQTTTPITLVNITGSSDALYTTLRPVSLNGTGTVTPSEPQPSASAAPRIRQPA